MSFKFKVGKKALLTSCDGDTCDKPLMVLVLARVTEETFTGKHYGYRVVDDSGECYTVEEGDLQKNEEEATPAPAPAATEVGIEGENHTETENGDDGSGADTVG